MDVPPQIRRAAVARQTALEMPDDHNAAERIGPYLDDSRPARIGNPVALPQVVTVRFHRLRPHFGSSRSCGRNHPCDERRAVAVGHLNGLSGKLYNHRKHWSGGSTFRDRLQREAHGAVVTEHVRKGDHRAPHRARLPLDGGILRQRAHRGQRPLASIQGFERLPGAQVTERHRQGDPYQLPPRRRRNDRDRDVNGFARGVRRRRPDTGNGSQDDRRPEHVGSLHVLCPSLFV